MNFKNLKSLTIPEGIVTKIRSGATVLWEAITYKNQVPISTDTDGSIFNGTGYIENRRLSSSGSLSGSAQNGSVTTGFIPFPNPDGTHGDRNVIRMKGVEWRDATANHQGHYYVGFYNSSKTKLNYIASETVVSRYSHIITVARDANGIETISFNTEYGTNNELLQHIRQASLIRITAYGKGADFVVTMNEEIT